MSEPQVALSRAQDKRAVEVRTEELAQFLRDALLRPHHGAGIVTVRMPLTRRLDPAALLGSLRGVDAWYLRTGDSEMLGLGAVRRIEARGAERFAETRRAVQGWSAETTLHRHPLVSEQETQRAFVGFAFAPGGGAEAMWAPFGEALAVLPRWSVRQSLGHPGMLEFNVDRSAPPPLDTIMAELSELLGAQPPPASEAGAVTVDHERPELHHDRVRAALAEIERGALGKVVVARRSAIFGDRDLDAIVALGHFLDRSHEGTVYFVRRSGSVLLGVTPERLLSVHQHTLETDALAGTAAHGHDAQLRASDKDREEHRFVIASIEEALGPLASELHVAEAPEIAAAGSVVHLKTKIRATLKQGVHPLEAAAALHPTSAVGGTPKAEASAWIARTEPERGWYGGPLGWVDANGDSELFVALRGGVIRGACAWAFAGGGIVRGSRPENELEEATLKMDGFLRALGAR